MLSRRHIVSAFVNIPKSCRQSARSDVKQSVESQRKRLVSYFQCDSCPRVLLSSLRTVWLH
jgi:hypothetical protein